MMLPARFDDENFAFYGKYLTGAQEKRARWKRCVDATDGDLGEALGKAYVAKTFGADGKQRTLAMVKNIETRSPGYRAAHLLTPQTKQKAIEKLHASPIRSAIRIAGGLFRAEYCARRCAGQFHAR